MVDDMVCGWRHMLVILVDAFDFLYGFGLILGYVSFTKLLIFRFLTYPNFVIKP
jgi:hypothetical protein